MLDHILARTDEPLIGPRKAESTTRPIKGSLSKTVDSDQVIDGNVVDVEAWEIEDEEV